MNLADVMDQVGDRLATAITGITVYRYPPGSVIPPAAVVSFPDTYTFDETYGRGSDKMTLSVVAVVGRPNERATRDNLAKYVAGSGPESFKGVLESGVYTAFDTVRVSAVEFDVITIGGTDMLAAMFDLDITGSGD